MLEYAEAAAPLDEVVEDKGVTILVDPKAVLFLIGTEVDYEVSRLAAKFTFRNPNQTDACGCGESVTIEPAKLVRAGRVRRTLSRQCAVSGHGAGTSRRATAPSLRPRRTPGRARASSRFRASGSADPA